MLHPLKLNLVWLIIDQAKSSINPESSDSEIIQHILDKAEAQLFLNQSEISDIHFYIKSRVPLIRDFVELQLIHIPKTF